MKTKDVIKMMGVGVGLVGKSRKWSVRWWDRWI